MATPGSPDADEADMMTASGGYPPGEDFGYTAGALEIDRWFRLRLHHIRRHVPRGQIPSAIAALRQTRTSDLKALRERCALERRYAARSARQGRHRPYRPDDPGTKRRSDRQPVFAPQP